MYERIDNPSQVRAADIASHINQGNRVIVQFSRPATDSLLRSVNKLCRRFGEQLTVRFYAHYGSPFDCRVLRRIPSAASLSIDCEKARHIEELASFEQLRELHLGVFELNQPEILAGLCLGELRSLTLGDTRRKSIDLGPLRVAPRLRRLHISAQTKHIEVVGSLRHLEYLGLSMIPNATRLGFVNGLGRLRSLLLILGGRSDIAEVSVADLRKLEIIRVRGLERFNPAAFPRLKELVIQDQRRIRSLEFTATNVDVKTLRIDNCTNLQSLVGIQELRQIRSLTIHRTALDFNALLAQRLPRSLKVVRLSTGRFSQDRLIQERLDVLGYKNP